MASIDVKPQVVKVPIPKGDKNLEVEALEGKKPTIEIEPPIVRQGPPPKDESLLSTAEPKIGSFGGQQVPLKPTIGRGPRVRGADVHNVNVRDAALEWYVVVEVMENSRFAEHAVCRECHWGTYAVAPGDGAKAVKEHALRLHIFSA